jgi:secreted PhoX family phosphatase
MIRKPTLILALAFTVTAAFADPFTPIDTNFRTTRHLVPAAPVQSAILFRGQVDTVTTVNGVKALSKADNDFVGYVAINGRSDSGYVIQNHEQNAANAVLGHGGGMSVFTAEFKNNAWAVVNQANGKFRQVDFSNVGGTLGNCGGGLTPWGTVTTGEEALQSSNSGMYNNGSGFADTTDVQVPVFNGQTVNKTLKRWQAMNWIVEVDPATARAVKKQYGMGRYKHEMGYSMPDGKTVYLANDDTPAAIYKFVSDTVGNYNKGQLYAYQQSPDGESGSWIALPMNFDSLLTANAVAFRRGASVFTRHEWITAIGGKIYITETGNDSPGSAHRAAIRTGATLPRHLATTARMNTDTTFKADYYGRILRLDPVTGKLDVFIEGGAASSGNPTHFANPDGMTAVTLGVKQYLVIAENINGTSQGRVSAAAASAGREISELYWLEIPSDGSVASRDSLKRMVVGPAGCELTGPAFTPDGKTLFLNIQHPSSSNPAPYNTAYTVAIWGYEAPTGLTFDAPRFGPSSKLQVSVNAISRFAYFDRAVDVDLYNTQGRRLERHKGVRMIDIKELSAGNYFLKFSGKTVAKPGETHQLIVQ